MSNQLLSSPQFLCLRSETASARSTKMYSNDVMESHIEVAETEREQSMSLQLTIGEGNVEEENEKK